MRREFTGSPLVPPNSTLQRFDSRYWNIDFPINAIATIISNSADTFTVNAEIRTNHDLIGVIWNTADRFGHPLLKYATDADYSGTIFAFVANPRDPYNFTVTLTTPDGQIVYRLFPYVVSGSNVVPNVTDPTTQGNGPQTNYVTASIFPGGVTVPGGYQIYVLNFDDLRAGYAYDQPRTYPGAISQLFFSVTTVDYQLGANAHVSDAGGSTVSSITVNNVLTGLVVTAGDQITWSATLMDGSFYEATFSVTTFSGGGTTSRTFALPAPIAFNTGGGALGSMQGYTALGSVTVAFTIANVSVTGSRATIQRYLYTQPAHSLMIATGFDDTYNLTPWRQADQIYSLGYRGRVVCYMGASHYFKASSSAPSGVFQNKIDTVTSTPLNGPTVAWCNAFFDELKAKSMDFIWSTSYEILYSYMPAGWEQQNYVGDPALSGYTPPTSFIRPTLPACLDYLVKVIKHGMSLLSAKSMNLYFQIGEPWWWDGSYSDGKPCIYDPTTTALYTTQTGLTAPTTIHNIYQQPLTSPENAYCVWLGQKLGVATGYIRDQVKITYSGALCTLLFFTPQIFNTQSVILPIINFPASDWSYPNYDFVQIEDYDWVIAGLFDKLPLTIQAAHKTLGYPINLIDYFVGFVNSGSQGYIWGNITQALEAAISAGISRYFVWAYPQVIRDGVVYQDFRSYDSMFIEAQFPIAHSYFPEMRPMFETAIEADDGGFETSKALWDAPLNKFVLQARYIIPFSGSTITDFNAIVNFFNIVGQGRANQFRLNCALDNSATGELIGTGDTTTTVFQLIKTYTSNSLTMTRKISKPVSGTVSIYLNAVLQSSGFTIDFTTGLVTFASAPGAAVAVTADFGFDFPVRFDFDELPITFDMEYGIAGLEDVTFMEVRL